MDSKDRYAIASILLSAVALFMAGRWSVGPPPSTPPPPAAVRPAPPPPMDRETLAFVRELAEQQSAPSVVPADELPVLAPSASAPPVPAPSASVQRPPAPAPAPAAKPVLRPDDIVLEEDPSGIEDPYAKRASSGVRYRDPGF